MNARVLGLASRSGTKGLLREADTYLAAVHPGRYEVLIDPATLFFQVLCLIRHFQ
jgi:hypothetical protein